MTNLFDIQRFGKLLKKHTVENYKGYLMSAVVLIGILSIAYSFFFYNQDNVITYGQRIVLFYGIFLFSGTIFTSTIFSEFGAKERAIAYLTLPASHLEKFILSWLYSFVVLSLVFVTCFYITDTTFISISSIPEKNKRAFDLFDSSSKIYYSFYVYAFFNSICLYGAFYFRKLHFIKTAFILFALVGIVIYVNKQMIGSMIPETITGAVPFNGFSIRDELKNYTRVWLESDVQMAYFRFVLLSVPFFLWTATYFQMKEKQV